MKQRVQGIIIGVLLTVFIGNFVAYASTRQSKIKVFYNNIKVMIDGSKFTPKNNQGKYSEPFTYNGTAYLPVKSLANALGKTVTWDAKRSTLYIGSKSYVYLDQVGSFNFTTKSGSSTYGTVTNVNGYKRGIEYKFSSNGNIDLTKNFVSPEVVNDEYLLNRKYAFIKGTLFCNFQNGGDMTILKIYGDEKLLYTSPSIQDQSSVPANINVSVKGVKILRFEYTTSDSSQIEKHVVFANGILLK